MKPEKAVEGVIAEFSRATAIHGPFRSCHEGWAVIKEEVDELWEQVKKKAHERNNQRLKEEATQIAAMGLRFLVDLVED